MPAQSFSEVLLEGLATDGGLTVPEKLPHVNAETLEAWRSLNYRNLAGEIISLFASDIAAADVTAMCDAAYSVNTVDGHGNFTHPDIVPLTPLSDGLQLVGLSEGPTLAFKDMAMQFLGQALEHVLTKTGRTLNVLGATSGDTGSSAEYALRGKKGVKVFMLSPAGRMSAFQRAQMYSLQDANIFNIAVEGVFDDCQALVKQLSGDLEFKRANSLGTVNSINLGRVIAQIVYYFWAYLRVTDKGAAAAPKCDCSCSGKRVSVTVPSGNFGNILAGHYAKEMGLPLSRLVLAANENNVLDEFFKTGLYRPRPANKTYATSSPSMDISKASNLERFVFELVHRDHDRLTALWREIDREGVIDLTAQLDEMRDRYGFASGSSTHADRVRAIKEEYAKSGILLDPHTADGVKVARETVQPGETMLVLETAKPVKFAETVNEAVGFTPPPPTRLANLTQLPQKIKEIPADAQTLKTYIEENIA